MQRSTFVRGVSPALLHRFGFTLIAVTYNFELAPPVTILTLPVWQYGYDSNGKVIWAKHPEIGNAQISISWDNIGVTITDQEGVKVRYERNNLGELVKAIAGFGTLNLTTQYAYDGVVA